MSGTLTRTNGGAITVNGYEREQLPERFWAKVEQRGECWHWTAATAGAGYGVIVTGSKSDKSRRMTYAHRLAYEKLVGPIPDGLQIDHLCKNTRCVNPAHMEPVTHRENNRRASNAQKTHCPQGHEYNEQNTHYDRNRHRHCRVCGRQRKYAEWLYKRQEAQW